MSPSSALATAASDSAVAMARISLSISVFMNWYNRRKALVER